MIRYLKCLNRLRLGHHPIFLEYSVNFVPRWSGAEGNPHLCKIIGAAESKFEKNLCGLADFEPLIRSILDGCEPAINWRNHFIPALDGLSIMSAAAHASNVYLEIGSGNSTVFARHAIQYCGRPVNLVSIDPEPRVEINPLCDEVIRKPLEDVDLTVFDQLQSGDVLFVDNSHRSFMNTDVTVFMLDVLPRLKPGVLVGLHDIFLPYDYLPTWSERGYNEQYMLGCYLLSNQNFFDLVFCNFFITEKRMHVEPLKRIWAMLGDEIRDRKASAFWGVKMG